MRKYLILIVFMLAAVLNAQDKKENQGQSIELPDFVITGVQSIDIPLQKKPRPELVPTLSREFFNPKYAPEEFELSDFSNPIRKDVDYFRSNKSNNGMFYVGAGIFTLPTGEFYFNTGGENVLFSSKLWGTNIKDYEDYSDYNVSGVSLNTDFFVSTASSFLPGLTIGVKAEYYRDAYKFYGSIFPSRERERQNGTASLSFTNNLDRVFKYGVELSGSLLRLSDTSLKEDLFSAKGFIEIDFNKLAVGGNIELENQKFQNLGRDVNNNFINTSAYLKIKTSNSLQAKLGINYSKQDTTSFFSPTATVNAKLGDNFALFADYSPYAEFISVTDMAVMNKYYNVGMENYITKVKNNIKLTLKYQYEKYFEIAVGGGYSKSDNFVYFEESGFGLNGLFFSKSADDVKSTFAYADLLFHLGPFGEFYSNISYQSVKNTAGNYIPFNPKFNADLVYKFYLSENLYLRTGVRLAFDYFSDSANLNKVNNYNNLFASAGYSLTGNLLLKGTVENILNNENYKWNRYKEKPFDVTAGVEYRW